MTNGLLQHLLLTLRLNFRSKQALVYGYVVPIFFLFAFGSVFRSGDPPLLAQMGQLLTITVLGGACFGMPTSMVSERERGVWRRYRLLPASTGGLIVNTMIARYLIVVIAAVMQVGLARGVYKTPLPAHWGGFLISFTCVSFAFLGLGLIIAMLAETVPAVQALGQAVFLPMIMIGGVGLPLKTEWARHVARFLPGRYAVDSIQACVAGAGLRGQGFNLLALLVIGMAGCVAGARMFRWDVGQRLLGAAKGWVAAALLPWVAIGLGGELLARHAAPSRVPVVATSQPATTPATEPVATTEPASMPPPAAGASSKYPYEAIDDADVASITYDDLEDDAGVVTPFARSLEELDNDAKNRLEDLAAKIEDWRPGKVADVGQRVRNLLCVAAIPDVLQDQNEAEIPVVVFEQLKGSVAKDKLIKALAWVITRPDDGTVFTTLPDLGFDGETQAEAVRERSYGYAKKMLGRLLGKLGPRPR